MAETTPKKITELTENTAAADTDLMMVGNAGTAALRRLKLGNLWKWIAKKIAAEVWNELTTSNKTILGAISELNSKIKIGAVKTLTPYEEVCDITGGYYIKDGVCYLYGVASTKIEITQNITRDIVKNIPIPKMYGVSGIVRIPVNAFVRQDTFVVKCFLYHSDTGSNTIVIHSSKNIPAGSEIAFGISYPIQ